MDSSACSNTASSDLGSELSALERGRRDAAAQAGASVVRGAAFRVSSLALHIAGERPTHGFVRHPAASPVILSSRYSIKTY